jgi:hypothetical protein
MFEVIVIIAVVLAVAVAAVLILAATRPDTFRVQRAATINAPADKVFADRGLSRMAEVVALGGPRSRTEADL